jgi:RNA polymerase sigma-70 factor (ECF subfamily)
VGGVTLPATGAPDAIVETDQQLIDAIARGGTDALARLYDRHAGVVYGLARRILPRVEDAEEVLQDVFAQVWREAARYDGSRGTVAGWMIVLARTRSIDRLRAGRARPDQHQPIEAPNVAIPERRPDPERAAISSEQARQVCRALDTLPGTQRELLELAYFEGLTQSEIAGRTGVPLGTVKTRIRTAMDMLRRALAAGTS